MDTEVKFVRKGRKSERVFEFKYLGFGLDRLRGKLY